MIKSTKDRRLLVVASGNNSWKPFLLLITVVLGIMFPTSSLFSAENTCYYFSEDFSAPPEEVWISHYGRWYIQDGKLNVDRVESGTMAHNRTYFFVEDFFALDVDVELVLAPHSNAGFGILPYNSGDVFFDVDGRALSGIGAIVYPNLGIARLLGWDVDAQDWYQSGEIQLPTLLTSIGVSYSEDAVTLRMNGQDSSLRFTGDFSYAPLVLDSLWLLAQELDTHVRFDNVCAGPWDGTAPPPTADGCPPPTDGEQVFTYNSVAVPAPDCDPAISRPFAVGSVAEGGDFLTPTVTLDKFADPIDVYLGYYSSALDTTNIFLIQSDESITTLSSAGLVPWRQNVLKEINASLFGGADIPVSSLPSGKYDLYLMVTPQGNFSDYYLWRTGFSTQTEVPLPPYDPPETAAILERKPDTVACASLEETHLCTIIDDDSNVHQLVMKTDESGEDYLSEYEYTTDDSRVALEMDTTGKQIQLRGENRITNEWIQIAFSWKDANHGALYLTTSETSEIITEEIELPEQQKFAGSKLSTVSPKSASSTVQSGTPQPRITEEERKLSLRAKVRLVDYQGQPVTNLKPKFKLRKEPVAVKDGPDFIVGIASGEHVGDGVYKALVPAYNYKYSNVSDFLFTAAESLGEFTTAAGAIIVIGSNIPNVIEKLPLPEWVREKVPNWLTEPVSKGWETFGTFLTIGGGTFLVYIKSVDEGKSLTVVPHPSTIGLEEEYLDSAFWVKVHSGDRKNTTGEKGIWIESLYKNYVIPGNEFDLGTLEVDTWSLVKGPLYFEGTSTFYAEKSSCINCPCNENQPIVEFACYSKPKYQITIKEDGSVVFGVCVERYAPWINPTSCEIPACVDVPLGERVLRTNIGKTVLHNKTEIFPDRTFTVQFEEPHESNKVTVTGSYDEHQAQGKVETQSVPSLIGIDTSWSGTFNIQNVKSLSSCND